MLINVLHCLHIMQGSFSYDNKSNGESSGFVEAEEIKQITSENRAAHCLLPNCAFIHCRVSNDPKEDVIPAAYVENLLLQSSNSKSWSLHDDESVDLTEPRFEKFHMPTVRVWDHQKTVHMNKCIVHVLENYKSLVKWLRAKRAFFWFDINKFTIVIFLL